jgi:hypothetical protein
MPGGAVAPGGVAGPRASGWPWVRSAGSARARPAVVLGRRERAAPAEPDAGSGGPRSIAATAAGRLGVSQQVLLLRAGCTFFPLST